MSAAIVEIEGKKFALGKMPARASFGVRVRLIRMVGEPVFRLLAGGTLKDFIKTRLPAGAEASGDMKDGATKADAGMDLRGVFDALMSDPDAISLAIRTLSAHLDPDELLSIADVVFESCRCDGKPMSGGMFDPTFAGMSPGAVEILLGKALQENYRNFLPAKA